VNLTAMTASITCSRSVLVNAEERARGDDSEAFWHSTLEVSS